MQHRHTLSLFILCAVIIALCAAQTVLAQTTLYTSQGKLDDNGAPAIGQYDFLFKLYDTQTVGTGTQQGGKLSIKA